MNVLWIILLGCVVGVLARLVAPGRKGPFGFLLTVALGMYEARYATREDIDAAMRLGCGLPMGPLALMDLIGLDTAYEILDTMYRRGGRDRRHAPVPGAGGPPGTVDRRRGRVPSG